MSPQTQNEICSRKSGATVAGIKAKLLKQVPISYPPIPEQRRIVTILDEAFAGIDTAIANTQRNLQNARKLFESHLNAVFSQKGEGWVEKRLGEIASFRNGLNFTRRSKGESIQIVGVKDFKNKTLVPFDELDSINIDGNLREIDVLQDGDILTVRSNGNRELIGRCILAQGLPQRVSHSGFTIRIRVESDEVDPAFLVRFMKSSQCRKTLVDSGGGANISNLNQQILSRLHVRFPALPDQREVVAQIDNVLSETQRLEALYQRKLDALAELKQSILQKAFSGELTAREAAA